MVLNPSQAADALQDADSDGISNLNEDRAGTHPQDAVSGLRITALEVRGSNAVLRFPSVNGRHYGIQHTDNPC